MGRAWYEKSGTDHDLAADQLVVFGVPADPEPDHAVRRFDSKGAVAGADPR
jgi:hypothetical protein